MERLKEDYVDGQPFRASDVNRTNAVVNELVDRVGGRGVQVDVAGENGHSHIQLDGVIEVHEPEYTVEDGVLICATDVAEDGELLLEGGHAENGHLLL